MKKNKKIILLTFLAFLLYSKIFAINEKVAILYFDEAKSHNIAIVMDADIKESSKGIQSIIVKAQKNLKPNIVLKNLKQHLNQLGEFQASFVIYYDTTKATKGYSIHYVNFVNNTEKNFFFIESQNITEMSLITLKNVYGENIDTKETENTKTSETFDSYKQKDITNTDGIFRSSNLNTVFIIISIYIEVGAIYNMRISTFYDNLSLSFSIGYNNKKKDEEEKTYMPINFRIGYDIINLNYLIPYIFAGGYYNYGIKNYKNNFQFGAGPGIIFFGLIFTELTYKINNEVKEWVPGIGFTFRF